jgi:N6-adenosine-specific RNA methylase IME4
MNQPRFLSESLLSRGQKTDDPTDPPASFHTILADPPWNVMQGSSRGAVRHYPLMTVEEIAALPVRKLASTDAHLWLWVTNATLFSGQAVMAAWGFTYRSCLTWVKPGLGLGRYYLRNSTEHLLLGTKGRVPILFRSQPTWLFARSRTTATNRKSSTP